LEKRSEIILDETGNKRGDSPIYHQMTLPGHADTGSKKTRRS